ncbi:MAG: aspartyl protease family protein [Janthinobacterium lividum]
MGCPSLRRYEGWLWLVLLLAVSRLGAAQPAQGHAFQLAKPGQRQVSFPFAIQRNLIVVSARLNGHGPYNFLLDTGVSTSIITDPLVADSLHLVRGTEYRIGGVGGQEGGLRAYETTGVRVELPGVVAPRLTWLVLSSDVLDLSGYAGTPIHGLLGAELFQSLVVAIHSQQGRLVCYDPTRYRAPKGRRWSAIPLDIDHNKAYLTAEISQLSTLAAASSLPLRLVLDTGAGHALSLETSADRRLHLPATRLRTDLGRGLTGLVSGYLGRVASVQLGRYHLPQVLTSFPDSTQVHERLPPSERSRQGNLGYEVLKRFEVVIDYPHKRLLLRATNMLREPFEHDMCGLDLLACGPRFRRYLVQRVVPESPAAAAAISEGDELLFINLVAAPDLSINDISRLLHSQNGRLVFLVVRRANGDLYSTTIHLRRQI